MIAADRFSDSLEGGGRPPLPSAQHVRRRGSHAMPEAGCGGNNLTASYNDLTESYN